MSGAFEKFKEFVERHAMLKDSRGVVVAVSGGPDSVALLDMLARLRDAWATSTGRAPLKVHVAHLDHKLRGGESAEDAEFVRRLADRLGFPFTIRSADTRAEAERLRRGIEEVAREIRYDFLLGVAREAGCDRIATGHTMSDQAETFIMRLTRGAGLRGLAAMRPVVPAHDFYKKEAEGGEQGSDGNILPSAFCLLPTALLVRPLLSVSREEVEEYCRDRRLEFRIDSTNLRADYTRNRLRRDALPALRSVNPRAVESIARAAEIIATDQDALDQLASKFLDQALIREEVASYSVETLLAQPVGLRRRMIIEAINRARKAEGRSGQITSAHVLSTDRLLEERMSGTRITLPGGLVVWREFDALVFTYAAKTIEAAERVLSAAQPSIAAGGFVLTLERDQPPHLFEVLIEQARREKEKSGRDWLIAVLDDRALPERLRVRPRRPGERALVRGQPTIKKLKNLMIDHKIPPSRRRSWPVVTTPDDCYVWSPGLPLAKEFAAHDETQRLAILRASTV
ncbi:MAG TPA: tRNA lysidine(34) synthetase TilS [Blastocatellia bacterium]|nr:tRNA lysidine(34) synthetase TilS [Blastocatellia bacterium]